MRRIGDLLTSMPRLWAVTIAATVVLVQGAVDYAVGAEMPSAIFYLAPVALAAWCAGRWAGVGISVLAGATWYVADALTAGYTSPFVGEWSAAVRLALFLLIGLIVSSLRASVDRERQLARSDPLTGVANGRSFAELAGREIARAARYRDPLTVVYIDIDDFKRVNDQAGHSAGDELLRAIAQRLSADTRSTDLVARLGGDEFGLLLPNTDRHQAKIVVEKLKERLTALVDEHGWPVGFSFGCVTYVRAPRDVDGMISTADALMYEVKRTGKNGIRYAEEA